MKREEIVEVFLKLLGLLGLVYAALRVSILIWAWQIELAPAPKGMVKVHPAGGFFMSQFVTLLTCLVGGILLLCLARRIAGWLVGRAPFEAEGETQFKIVSREGFRFCLGLLGVYVLFRAAPVLASAFVAGSLRTRLYSRPYLEIDWIKLTGAAVQLALGIYLLRGGNYLVRLAWGKQQTL